MIEHLLTHTLTLYRPVYSIDAAGGSALAGYDTVGALACKPSQPSSAEIQDAAAKWGAELTHVVHALAGADVQRGDELGGPIPSLEDGERLRVLAVVRDSHATYTRVECETVQAEPASDEEGSSS